MPQARESAKASRPKPPRKRAAATKASSKSRAASDSTRPWATAFLVLPKARTARAKRVTDARSFADAAFDLPCSFQVGWKSTLESLVEELEGRFAPAHYLDHENEKNSLVLWCEDAQGRRTRTVRLGSTAATVDLVAAVAELVGYKSIPLAPLNDGDDLHFLLVERSVAQRVQALLGPALLSSLVDRPVRKLDPAADGCSTDHSLVPRSFSAGLPRARSASSRRPTPPR